MRRCEHVSISGGGDDEQLGDLRREPGTAGPRDPIEAPPGNDTFRLSQSSRNADYPTAEHGFLGQVALPTTRRGVGCERGKPAIKFHGHHRCGFLTGGAPETDRRHHPRSSAIA
jgi:hypothetical protein